jgi:hypothetical protein
MFNKKGTLPMNDVIWDRIVSYYMMHSTEYQASFMEGDLVSEVSFLAHTSPSFVGIPSVTAIRISEGNGVFYTAQDSMINLAPNGDLASIVSLPGTVTHFQIDHDAILFLDAGNLGPHDAPLGSLRQMKMGSTEVSRKLTNLFRPVHMITYDSVYIVAEFGHTNGRMVEYDVQNGNQNRILAQLPGIYKMFIFDRDRDGAMDLVFTAAQALEGIYSIDSVFMNPSDPVRVVSFPPQFGISDMDTADVNGDGFIDLVIANGDNADYSNQVKAYHGIRVLMNDGEGGFKEQFFHPLPGATQVRWIDVNEDGQDDIVTSSFFPDEIESSIRLLINVSTDGSNQLSFSGQSLTNASQGRWMVMDTGDIDGDGDQDIALGSYIDGPTKMEDASEQKWMNNPIDVLLLYNQHHP